jgi:hypothetical protein
LTIAGTVGVSVSLLREIQASLMQGEDIGPILLKLRFLASRLGSAPLEEWVKHESEGYPVNIEIPEYRKVPVSYVGTFSGPFGSGIRNAPIPPVLIDKYAGEHWTRYEVRQSVSAIDDLLAAGQDGTLHVNAANLILLLQGHVYEHYACNSVSGTLSKASLVELQNAVRTRVLELTIQLEKSIPTAAEITLGPPPTTPIAKDMETVTQITQQIVHGNVTTITSSGDSAQFNLTFKQGDQDALIRSLVDAGIAKRDATDVAQIIASEQPESREEPFGTKARAWLGKNLSKAANGTWKVGVSVATKVLTEAALRYYGLK